MFTLRARLLLLPVLLAFLLAVSSSRARAANEFPLQDGDTWVMTGDSITAQHLHSNYFEAFCYARYPKLTFRFRNSGVGGDTVPKVLARFDWDVAAWKPTVVSVELGMNDQGGYKVEQFIDNMGQLSERIKALKARPVFFTSSPINNGDTNAKLGGNTKLHQYAVALKALAAKQEVPFADQFHLVIDVWGKNKPHEVLARTLPALKATAADDNLAGVEHLRAFLAAVEKSKAPLVSMEGDPVHPGPPGQLIMAAALLKELGARGFVSSVTLDADGKVIEAKGCQVNDGKTEGGKLAFDRLDESIPFPIPEQARSVLPLFPTILDLSQYTLKVNGVPVGQYVLKVNGVETATVRAEDLLKGINLTVYSKGPIAAQGKRVLDAVAAKEALVGGWRALSRKASAKDASTEDKEKLAEQTQKVEEADARIRAAAKPQKLHFELSPAK